VPGTSGRRALPLAGDFPEDKDLVTALYDEFGFDAGKLGEGWRFEQGMPGYCVRMDRPTLVNALSRALRRSAA